MKWRSKKRWPSFSRALEGVRYRHDALFTFAGNEGRQHDTAYGHSMAYTEVEMPIHV